jgi:outer membrane protein assembly factor BamB
VGDDTIYFGDGKAYFYALDRFTGAVRWRVWLKMSDETSAPSLSRGAVYFTTDHGELRALKRADGTPLWKIEKSLAIETPPVLANGMIFVINQAGAQVALK